MKTNWIKYVIVVFTIVFIFVVGMASLQLTEKVFSQYIAQVATQQFNENVNAYANITTYTGIKNGTETVIMFLMFLSVAWVGSLFISL